MCKKRNSVKRMINGKGVRLDSCLGLIVPYLNELGLKTIASCCGHGKHKPTIIIEGHCYLTEFFTEKIITRNNFKIYTKDSEGFYFISEVENSLAV